MSTHVLAADATPRWFKSSHSNPDGAACVEVATTPATVVVRDSKNPDGPRLTLAPAAWTGFLPHVHVGGVLSPTDS